MDKVAAEQNEMPDETILLVVSTSNNQLKIRGDIMRDKISCYGLLEAIRDEVQRLHVANANIVKPDTRIVAPFTK